MYQDFEVTPEEEDEMIKKIAQKIHSTGLDVVAIFTFEGVKPVSHIGAMMGRLFVSPFLLVFGKEIEANGEKFLQVFEKRDNVEKLIKAVEELVQEEKDRKKDEKAKKLDEKSAKTESGETPTKKGWRSFF